MIQFSEQSSKSGFSEGVIVTEQLEFKAYAKINLSLEIVGKRPDGFHELVSVMQTVGLYDRLLLKPASDLEFDCNIPELVEETNLVWKAALALLERCPVTDIRGADIVLEKNIPIAAGLGGGSSDGAIALVGLNQLWELNLSQTELEEIAATLGSDVPFFIRGGTALAEGRGEKLTPLPALPLHWLVLLYPTLPMPENKTRELYKMLTRHHYSNGSVTRALVGALQKGENPPQSLFFNNFEQVVYERFFELDQYRQALVDAGAEHVRVSGSGPTLFSIVHDEAEARQIVAKLTDEGYVAFAVPTVN